MTMQDLSEGTMQDLSEGVVSLIPSRPRLKKFYVTNRPNDATSNKSQGKDDLNSEDLRHDPDLQTIQRIHTQDSNMKQKTVNSDLSDNISCFSFDEDSNISALISNSTTHNPRELSCMTNYQL